MALAHLNLIAGIAWNPGIRGILVVLTGFAVLCGSVYLLLATNVGARLGMLVAFAGLFGWLSILTLIWWISPPAIGPRGTNPSWKPVEIYVDGGGQPKTEVVGRLPSPENLPVPADIIAGDPVLQKDFPNPQSATLSDIEGASPGAIERYIVEHQFFGGVPDNVDDYTLSNDLGGWRLTPASSAGEAQAAADVALTTTSNFFQATTDYKKLSVFEIGGKPTRSEYCPNDNSNGPHNLVPGEWFCRIQYKVSKLVDFKHPTHYAVVQVQAVVPQETVAGQAPPTPKVDPTKPVVSVVLVRDLGNVRLLPAVYFVISFSLFVVLVLILHYRDKTLARNLAAAESAAAEA